MRSDIADVLEYIRQRGPARTSKMGPFDLLFKIQWETIWRQRVTEGRLPWSTRPNVAARDVGCSGLHVGLVKSNPIRAYGSSPHRP